MNFISRIISSVILLLIIYIIYFVEDIFFYFFLIICSLIAFYEWVRLKKKLSHNLIGSVFIFYSFYSIYLMKIIDNNVGNILLIYIFLICVSSDLGGYFFGKLFKGPKLIKISPNKTYAGVIGAYFFTSVFTLLILIYENQFLHLTDIKSEKLFLFSILISTISQIGDLIVSFYKRLGKVKDTGNLIPGHGGLLDRIDGMIFAYPFSMIIFNILN